MQDFPEKGIATLPLLQPFLESPLSNFVGCVTLAGARLDRWVFPDSEAPWLDDCFRVDGRREERRRDSNYNRDGLLV